MAKKMPVHSLADSALAQLGNTIVASIGTHSDEDLDQLDTLLAFINEYLERVGATGQIRQDLLIVILRSPVLDARMRLTCLRLLLDASVPFLSPREFPFSYYNMVLDVIAKKGAGLRTLNLKGIWLRDEHIYHMHAILSNSRQLKKLCVPHIADDNILGWVGEFSFEMAQLDVSGESDITEIGLDLISRSVCRTNLTVVDVGMPGELNICFTDVALLLLGCPNLRSLVTYSFVGSSLKYIVEEHCADFVCGLRYLHDTQTPKDVVRIIMQTCPKLESLYLDSPRPEALSELVSTRLNKLKIHRFNVGELMATLERIGTGLAALSLIKGTGVMDLSEVARMCPNLVDLDCNIIEKLIYTEVMSRFRFMETFTTLSSEMGPRTVFAFLYCHSHLLRLALDECLLTQADVERLFGRGRFRKLESIWISMAPNFNVATVQFLIANCPQLDYMAQLSGWKITTDDMALLKAIIKSINSCIVCIYRSPFKYN